MRQLSILRHNRGALVAIAIATALAMMSGLAQAAPGSHSQKEVNQAVEKGVAYLDTQQNENGSYGATEPFAETGMTLVAYGVLANGSFGNLSSAYQAHVKKALEWLVKEQAAEGSWGGDTTYDTGIALAGLAAFESADSEVPAAIKKGREYLEGEFQGTAFTGCSSEEGSETAYYCGGWNYDKGAGRSDESNTGYALFGLHQSGGVPSAIASQDVGWQHHIQAIKSNPFASNEGKTVTYEDGGGCYQPEWVQNGGTTYCDNANDTGSMLFGMGYDGLTTSNEGVKAGVKFGEDVLQEYELEKEVSRTAVYHVNEKEDGTCKIEAEGCDWFFAYGEGGYHYSMFSITKGLGEFVQAKLSEANNWYAKVVDLLLTQQESGGSWPADLRDDASTVFATALSVGSLGLVGVESKISTVLSGEAKSGEKLTVKEGSAVTDQATLKGTEVATATGKVTYDVYSDSECTKLVAEAGSVTVSEGKVPPSSPETLGAGTYYWQATYSGDASHGEAATKCGEELLTVEKTGGGGPKPTQLATSLSGGGQHGASITVPEGTVVADAATLSGENSAKAGGTVTYRIYTSSTCEGASTEAGSVSVSEGKVPVSNSETLAPGTYYWQASYSGDGENEASKSGCGSEIETVKEKEVAQCSMVVGFAHVTIRKEGEAERVTVTNNLSTNLAAKQKLQVKVGATKLNLIKLTAATCTATAHKSKFTGTGTATVGGEGGWRVSFYFVLKKHGGAFAVHINAQKHGQPRLVVKAKASRLSSEKIS